MPITTTSAFEQSVLTRPYIARVRRDSSKRVMAHGDIARSLTNGLAELEHSLASDQVQVYCPLSRRDPVFTGMLRPLGRFESFVRLQLPTPDLYFTALLRDDDALLQFIVDHATVDVYGALHELIDPAGRMWTRRHVKEAALSFAIQAGTDVRERAEIIGRLADHFPTCAQPVEFSERLQRLRLARQEVGVAADSAVTATRGLTPSPALLETTQGVVVLAADGAADAKAALTQDAVGPHPFNVTTSSSIQ